MELLSVIMTRKTARSYCDAPVSAEIITELVELAAAAPSACNKQGWKCLLIEKSEDFDWLFKSGGSSVFKTTKQALVVCYQNETDNSEWHDNIQSAAAFIAYFQLVAHDRGIGSCWICHLPSKRDISTYFEIPTAYTPVAVVSFGYYKEGRTASGKIATHSSRIVARHRWDFTSEEATAGYGSVFKLRKIARALYYKLPNRHWLRALAGKYEKKFDGD